MQTKKVIAIIWWGAAGMMAAASILDSGVDAEIHLFEKNSRLWAKVLISGGGRCNVTTWLSSKKELLTKYARWSEFLGSHTFKVFSPKKCFNWFEEHGVKLKIEEDLRVFPVSNNGADVVWVFERLFQKHELNIHFAEWVDSISLRHGPIICEDSCPREKNFLIVTNKNMYQADFLIVTTGGNAFAHTGSTGDWYAFARQCGHTVVPLGPSLNSFMTEQTWPHNLSGLALPTAELAVKLANGELHKASWPLLFTHFGITWPVVFALSSHMAYEKITKETPLLITINPDATKNYEYWEALLKQVFAEYPKKELQNIVWMQSLPRRLMDEILIAIWLKPHTQWAHVSKDERKKLAHALSGALKLDLVARRPWDEFVTAWGVSLEEVNPKTMESKLCSGLYFAWEVLDIDWVTWGFNLQSSWATGYVAWTEISKIVSKNSK